MKFDCVIMNPPYDNGLHEKFLLKMLQISDKVVSVQPLSWLLGKRQNKKITAIIDKSTAEIEQINGNTYFDAAIGGTMGIIYVNTHKNDDISFDGKSYSKCEEITTYSNDELLVSILNKIGCKHLKDNVHEHVVKGSNEYLGFSQSRIINNPNLNWWCVRLTPFAGSGSIGKTGMSFYSVITKENSLGQYKDLLKLKDSKQKSLLRYYIHFDTEKEAKNCYKYLLSDFARICLYFIKTNMHLDSGELKYIPWQDFTEEWTDEKLFKKYGITKDEIEHIYEILPDYYRIRKGNIKFDGKAYSKCEEITTYSNDELLVEFKNIVEPLAKKDNLNNHLKLANKILPSDGRNKYLELNPVLNDYCVKIPAIGNKASILYSKSYKQNEIDTYENIYNKELKLYFSFKSKQTAINFYNYITGYFPRMCLKLLKTNLNLGKGEMALIPWFDFSDPVFSKSPSEIDDYLFKKYNISDKIRKHIEEILPDYYGIRKGNIKFDGKSYSKCEEITTYSNDELLVSILNKIGCKNLKDNVHEHVVKEPNTKAFSSRPIENNPNINWYILSFTAMRGHKGTNDFYTIISNIDKELNKRTGLYKDVSKITIKTDDKKGNHFNKKLVEYYFAFNTENELNNYIKYLKTDFIRICLYLIKTNMHLDSGELKYIPWQDFTEEWTDEKLFKKYGITKDEIEHIYEILPNYYNIDRIDLTKYKL